METHCFCSVSLETPPCFYNLLKTKSDSQFLRTVIEEFFSSNYEKMLVLKVSLLSVRNLEIENFLYRIKTTRIGQQETLLPFFIFLVRRLSMWSLGNDWCLDYFQNMMLETYQENVWTSTTWGEIHVCSCSILQCRGFLSIWCSWLWVVEDNVKY